MQKPIQQVSYSELENAIQQLQAKGCNHITFIVKPNQVTIRARIKFMPRFWDFAPTFPEALQMITTRMNKIV